MNQLIYGVVATLVCCQLAAAEKPNILLILADDVGSEVLECYGGESYPTPNIDRLASQGLRFTHAFTMPACHATRTTLLSGQYWVRMGRPQWGTYPSAAENRTLAHVLQRAGYATAVAGKWQLALLGDDPDQPHRMGFDQYALFGWHEGPRYYQPHIRQNGALREDVADRYGPDVYCDFLIDFMTAERSQPFFAFYSMALCHDVTDDLDQPVPVGPNGRYQTYAEMVAAMDDRVGRLVDTIDDAAWSRNTLVLFFTDNGSPARTIVTATGNDLIRAPVVSQRNGVEIPGGKTQLTDSGTRVPLIVRWPGQVARGTTTDQLVDVSDMLPTLAEIAGGDLAKHVTLDGQSFAPLLLGKQSSPREWVYAEHKLAGCVRNHRWKLYRDGRLFDMAQDPQESTPLVGPQLAAHAAAERDKLQEVLGSLRP
ncbi:MAG: sulfatase-like hydrolase/transferase [Bythopirellula sp.]